MSVDVQLSHPYRDSTGKRHEVGARVTLDDNDAHQVITSGRGVPATKSAAQAAGVDPESAATAKK